MCMQRSVCGCNCVGSQQMKRVHFGKLANHKSFLCYVSYLAKQVPEFLRRPLRVTLGLVPLLGPLGVRINPFFGEILSLCFVLVVSSLVSPFQKSRGFKSGQILANSQCLLRMSAGLDLLCFQLNWRYAAVMVSLTL